MSIKKIKEKHAFDWKKQTVGRFIHLFPCFPMISLPRENDNISIDK